MPSWSRYAQVDIQSYCETDRQLLQTVRPVTAFALIQELIFRDGLRIALGGRDDVTLEPILNFLARHIDDSRFGGMAAEVADVLIGESSVRPPSDRHVADT
jgi:hypothetical protein